MTDFKTQKIRKFRIKKNKTHTQRSWRVNIPVMLSITIIVFLLTGIVKAFSTIDYSIFLSVAGDQLTTDRYGHTNFLLLGTADEENEGTDLTDTIIVASLDHENKIVTMMSIPRDFHIEDNLVGDSRINKIYIDALSYYDDDKEKALEHMAKKVEEITATEIHYWAKVNFKGFKEVIDAIGGIDVYVEEAIFDPYYPKDGTYLFETFAIEKGLHHMDGETALKYARSRKTTSDFDRASRQQQILYAIKEQALDTKVLLSREKIENILLALKNNIETNISVQEILTLGGMANNFSRDNIVQKFIHDDPTQCGGFLYTPQRKLYGGAFVLIPANTELLHKYIDLIFHTPEIIQENAKIHVLNGTKQGGIAGENKQILQRYCFDVIRYGNGQTQDITETTYYYLQKYDTEGNPIESRPLALDFLQTLIPGKETAEIPDYYKEYMGPADILIEIGSDYVNSPDYIDDPFLYLVDMETYGQSEGEVTEGDETPTQSETNTQSAETAQ